MKLQLNGTGASEAFPSLFCTCKYCTEARELGGKNLRRRTSSCIDEKILIDFSADTYALSTQAHVDLSKIHHLIVTHSHADHFFLQIFTIYSPLSALNRILSRYTEIHLSIKNSKKSIETMRHCSRM